MDDLRYPFAPSPGKTDTSAEAAEKVSNISETLEVQVLNALKIKPMTNSELAGQLKHDAKGVQPRTSELRSRNLIVDTGERHKNGGGNNEIVWGLNQVTTSCPISTEKNDASAS
ncbi:MAG: hypothetical protein JKY34_08625 [Kordiimonadaceae bacterium]|nr:hypothetical protein [Kordiimonadaceae bacterium]